MKKIILFSLIIIPLFSCQKNEPQRYFTSSHEIDEIKTLIKDYEDANWKNWITHYGDTAKIYHNSMQFVTPNELKEDFKKQNAQLATYQFSKDDAFYEMIIDDKGEKWVYFWATWQGNLANDGKLIEVPVHLAAQFINGKIVREYTYYDNAIMMTAIQDVNGPKEAISK